MTKKITAALLCLVLVLSLSGCSFAETVGNWLDSIGDMIPNDVELVLGQLTGREEVSAEHEIIFSEGYVNMLKSGVYHIVYSLSDGTEVEIGSNGIRFGSTYPEPAELEGVEPQYDENGNPIEPEIPHEHIVLSDGIYYYIDDNQAKMFTVNPANYKAVPIEISAENIAFAERELRTSAERAAATSGTQPTPGTSLFTITKRCSPEWSLSRAAPTPLKTSPRSIST